MSACEFRLLVPTGVLPAGQVSNPKITLELGTLTTGISSAFESCQMEWTWTHKCWYFNVNTNPAYFSIAAHPMTAKISVASCEAGNPMYDATPLSRLHLYQACDLCIHEPTVLTNATVESSTVIHAFFNWAAFSSRCDPERFLLRNQANETDRIRCVLSERQPNENEYVLTLESPMMNYTTYILKAMAFCGTGEGPTDSEYEFLYEESFSTLLQSGSAAVSGSGIALQWELSEVDAGVEFFVSRSENGGEFVPLDMNALAREGLSFTYADSRVEPGKGYVYRVEYTIDGISRLLCISEEVRVPVSPLALHQNHPNPFNPVTKISYSLSADCAVQLEVFDTAGRLVSRLVDGERQSAGLHGVAWNGRDGSGRAVASGIYVYRLVASKSMISRKMVLLK